MKGLITHEESQAVTIEFRKRNHIFYSCDLKECSGGKPEWHHVGDVFKTLRSIDAATTLNFLGMHPDCTKLTNAGIRWLSSRKPRDGYLYSEEWSDFNGRDTYINPVRWDEMVQACDHFKKCYEWLKKVGKGYIENPRMHPYAAKIIGIPSSQYIHPYYFGSPQMKETHLWIVGLPLLERTSDIEPPKDKRERLKWQDVWMASPGPDRAEKRSKTDPAVAAAFAEQWGIN